MSIITSFAFFKLVKKACMNIFSEMLDFLLQINNWMELNTKWDMD